MKTLSISKDRLYIIYYLLLLLLMFFQMKPNVEISMNIRMVFFVLTFLPVVFRIDLLPFVFLCFYEISSTSFTQILPSQSVFYIVVVFVFYFLYKKKTIFLWKALFLFLYFFICSLFHLDFINEILWWLIFIFLADMINSKKDLQMIFFAFLNISLFLSILYLIYREEFLVQYGKTSLDVEYSGWTNPNVFGATIGAGGVLAMSYLTNFLKFERNKFFTILSIVVLLLSFIVLALNSSRGSLLAFALPIVIMLFISKLNLWIKMITIFVVIGFLVLLLQNNIFDLLFVRLNEDSMATGGSRTVIWENKLELFFNQSNIFELFLGIGKTSTTELGGDLSTHNDIITSFIGFGLIGFLLFVYYFILYPIKVASKEARTLIILLSMYIVIECCVLEPVFRAIPFFMMFYFFVLKYSIIEKSYTSLKPFNS